MVRAGCGRRHRAHPVPLRPVPLPGVATQDRRDGARQLATEQHRAPTLRVVGHRVGVARRGCFDEGPGPLGRGAGGEQKHGSDGHSSRRWHGGEHPCDARSPRSSVNSTRLRSIVGLPRFDGEHVEVEVARRRTESESEAMRACKGRAP
jgi:hypothetical protein